MLTQQQMAEVQRMMGVEFVVSIELASGGRCRHVSPSTGRLAQGSSVHPAGGGCGVTADWFEDHLPTISLWLSVFLLLVFLWPLAWAAATGEFLPNWAYDEDAWAIDLALRLHSALS